MTRQALELLNSRRNDPYEAATAALREDALWKYVSAGVVIEGAMMRPS
jgi:hypothetical protein